MPNLLRPALERPIQRPIYGIDDPLAPATGVGGGWSPLVLFSAGEQGFWYDPSDLSSMFQDAAGTVPVTAVGDSVGLIRDKSGRGNHASQATGAFKPKLQQESGRYYLQFDGSDDYVTTPSIDLSATDEMTLAAGIRKESDAATGLVLESSTAFSSNNGTFAAFAPPAAANPNFGYFSRGTSNSTPSRLLGAAPVTAVVGARSKISADFAEARVNGAVGAAATDQGTGNYGNYPVYIGRRGGSSLPFNGRLYPLVLRAKATSDTLMAQLEAYINSKTGAY